MIETTEKTIEFIKESLEDAKRYKLMLRIDINNPLQSAIKEAEALAKIQIYEDLLSNLTT